MARRHKPVALKLISGSRRIPSRPEPDPPGDLVEPPEWMTPAQKESWAYAIEHAPAGLMRKIDRAVLSAWCAAETAFVEASVKVSELGLVVKSADGVPMQSPFLSVRNRALVLMLKCGAELGFSPSSRSGIAAAPSGGNPFRNNGVRPDPAA